MILLLFWQDFFSLCILLWSLPLVFSCYTVKFLVMVLFVWFSSCDFCILNVCVDVFHKFCHFPFHYIFKHFFCIIFFLIFWNAVYTSYVSCFVIISSVQSLSYVQLFATPWIAARQVSLSITNSRSSPKLMSIESVILSSHLILCRPLLILPPIPPSIRIFSNESDRKSVV